MMSSDDEWRAVMVNDVQWSRMMSSDRELRLVILKLSSDGELWLEILNYV